MSLAEHAREHLAHPPRMRPVGGGYIVEVYSPVKHGYIVAGDVMSHASAERDLEHWQEAHGKEQGSFAVAGAYR